MTAPASSRPLILVSTDLFGDPVREGIRRQYLDAVIDAGGLPVQVPVGLDEDSIEALVESASGLLLTGGADVDPKLYGEEKSEKCGAILSERDEAECALTRAALREGLPVLAICRGLQVLNVVAGGTLIQDIPEELGLPLTAHRQEGDYVETVHEVEIVPGTLLASIVGEENLAVNTKHHQAVKTPASSLRVVAKSPDGVVEALVPTASSRRSKTPPFPSCSACSGTRKCSRRRCPGIGRSLKPSCGRPRRFEYAKRGFFRGLKGPFFNQSQPFAAYCRQKRLFLQSLRFLKEGRVLYPLVTVNRIDRISVNLNSALFCGPNPPSSPSGAKLNLSG